MKRQRNRWLSEELFVQYGFSFLTERGIELKCIFCTASVKNSVKVVKKCFYVFNIFNTDTYSMWSVLYLSFSSCNRYCSILHIASKSMKVNRGNRSCGLSCASLMSSWRSLSVKCNKQRAAVHFYGCNNWMFYAMFKTINQSLCAQFIHLPQFLLL